MSENLRRVPKGAGSVALTGTTRLPGLEESTKLEAEEPKLIPKDYDMSPDVMKRLEERMRNPDLAPFEDPDGVIVPGLLLTSPHDPEHRRLIAHMYRTPQGQRIVVAHIEGEPALRNTGLEDLRQKIAEGRLKPVSESPKA